MQRLKNFKQLPHLSIILLLLYFGKALFIPLAFSIFISFILYPLCKWFEGKGLARSISIGVCLVFLFIPIVGIAFMLLKQFFAFMSKFSEVKEKIPATVHSLLTFVSQLLGLPPEKIQTWIVESVSGSFNIIPFLKDSLALTSVSIVLIFLIPVYSTLILYYRRNFYIFLCRQLPDLGEHQVFKILTDIAHTYFRFIKGMIVVYLIVGILNSIGLLFLNIPNPFLFGFIASILTIVPYFGITIGALVPVSIALITNESLLYPLGVIVIFIVVQILEANVIFPLAVGKRLQLNPLIVLISVIAGGILWGVSGMILFIPALGVAKLISDRIPEMKSISILIGRSK